MIIEVSFEADYSEDEALAIQRLNPEIQIKQAAVVEGKPPRWRIGEYWSYYKVQSSDLLALGVKGWRVHQVESHTVVGILGQLLDKVESLTGRAPLTGPTYNEKCNVHVPGLGLLLIDEVRLAANCCTDDLQVFLEDGWRIVACCPQPDQRRPDYVLGRTKI